eukprot:TsM_000546600 transcript=TsM_000546600 gene=TsM_000546600
MTAYLKHYLVTRLLLVVRFDKGEGELTRLHMVGHSGLRRRPANQVSISFPISIALVTCGDGKYNSFRWARNQGPAGLAEFRERMASHIAKEVAEKIVD